LNRAAGVGAPQGQRTEATPAVIRAVVIEDSPTQQGQLVRILQADGDIEVVGTGTTAGEAIGLVDRTRPDVIALGLQRGSLCPATDGTRSVPALDALAAGALDVLPRPSLWTSADEAQLRRCMRSLHKVGIVGSPRRRSRPNVERAGATPVTVGPVVALAASTGGPPALAEVLSGLGGLTAPVLVVQHIHPDFVGGLVTWMSRACPLPVELARHGEAALPGHVYIAGGGFHLHLEARSRLGLSSTPVTLHRPSADELFRSVAEHAGAAGVGVVLTGMGDDGARGLLALRQRGGRTLAQDEATCAVFGMPQASQRLGSVKELLPLGDIAAAVLRAVRGQRP
jgi:two-component system chemotaxis response regulator CheB